MNPYQCILRRLFVILGLASGVLLWSENSKRAQGSQKALALGGYVLFEDKLYFVDSKLIKEFQPIQIDCQEGRLLNKSAGYGFSVDPNGQMILTKHQKNERQLKQKMLLDTRNPNFDEKELKASSWRYVYALEVDPREGPDVPPPPEKRPAIVIAAESVELDLGDAKKVAARPVLLRPVQNGDTLLKFEVRYTSGK